MNAIAGLTILAATLAAPADSTFNVLDYGAVGDGEIDNTQAFQKALNAASANEGGIVFAPTGRYAFDGVLDVPKQVTLKGTYSYAPAHAGIRDKSDELPTTGTVLLPRGHGGSEEGPPFILLNTNATLQGVAIFYPDQDAQAEVPTAYPYAVAMRGNNPALLDVQLLNPYNGIDASKNQRHLIRNVHGQPLHIGLYIDSIYDIGRVENVHWNPWWTLNTPAYNWQYEQGTGFVFGRTDWHYVLNTFCFGYNIGYRFLETESGVTNGNFLGIGADNCTNAVLVEGSARYGILITNGEFVSFNGERPTQVRVAEGNNGSVRFSNCAFWGPCRQIAHIDGHGTIGFSDCTFVQWGKDEPKTHAVEAVGGTVLVRGCEFQDAKPHVRLGPDVQRAVVTDNVVKGKPLITNESKGDTAIANNVGTR